LCGIYATLHAGFGRQREDIRLLCDDDKVLISKVDYRENPFCDRKRFYN